MKILFIILVIFLIIPSLSYAGDDAKYEVIIRIKYNAVSVDKASEVIGEAQKRYSDACEVEVTSKKVADNSDHRTTVNIGPWDDMTSNLYDNIHATWYDIVIKIKYNAVPICKANGIIRDAQKRHAGACEVELTSKKVANSITGAVGHFNWVPGSLEIIDREVDDPGPTMPGTLKINDATTSYAN
jgi:hypothetical protein